KKVAEQARQGKAIADQGKKKPEKPPAGHANKAAPKQRELIPPTNEGRGAIKSSSSEAAKKLDDAAKKMEEAKEALAKREQKPGADNADKATQDLLDAHKELTKALDEKKGEELADQASLQPNRVDPAQAAKEIAKALQLTNEARMQAEKA